MPHRHPGSRSGLGATFRRVSQGLAACVLTAGGAAAAGGAADAPAGEIEAPFAARSMAEVTRSEAGAQWEFLLGQRAVEAGFYSLAEGFFRQALARPEIAPGLRDPIALELATALIALEKPAEVERVLEDFTGPRDVAWRIRRAALDFLRGDHAALEEALPAINPLDLPAGDVGTYHFLRSIVLDRAGETAQADAAMEEAFSRGSTAQRALFRLAQYQRRLTPPDISDGAAAQLRAQIEQFAGARVAFQYTLIYAVMLERLGRTAEAGEVLKRQVRSLPAAETDLRDQTLLLLGLVAGAGSADGREAFGNLVATGTNRDLQRAALVRMAASVPPEGGGEGAWLLRRLDELLGRDPPHPLTEDLLFFRAEMLLRNRAFERAETDANALLTRFPGSDLRRHALALLASSSWQRGGRYRTAADWIIQLREGTPPGRERAALAVLLAECYFRAGEQGTVEDFRNAAEAYGVALAESGSEDGLAAATGVSSGTLFYQRVLSLIYSDNAAAAAALLDAPAAAAIDEESRWQAEWNLERFMQLHGRRDEAYARAVTAEEAPGLPAALRLRFLWLAAQVSLQIGRPAETLTRVQRVQEYVGGIGAAAVDARLQTEVVSNAALLAAQAQLDLGNPEEGVRAMERLRTEFAGSRAAVFSYIVQARYLAAANRLAEAQKILIDVAQANPESEYAPVALYEAALQAERREQDEYLTEASQLLRELADKYPEERYLFPARLKQADVLRKLNQFGLAAQIYEFLESSYPNRPDRVIVELSLADTLMAQAGTDPARFEGAVSRLERLTDLPAAPLDLRVEAGVKLGFGWLNHEQPEHAARVFWDVYNRFIGDAATARQLGATGRYWVGRALIELGQFEEKAGRVDDARRLYQAVLDHGLPGERIARGLLARIQGGG